MNDNDPADPSRRRTLVRLTAAAGGVAAAGASVPFVMSLGPSERARAAGAPVEVNTAPLEPEKLHTIEWRGRPVWILRRTGNMLARLDAAEPFLSDPASQVSSQQPDYAKNPVRSIDPNHWLSRAARGHTWNGEAAIRRRHTH